ncbi:outer membrane lipoprotein chaperone LolA [Halorhodospira halophila]|uniref:Outer-membrane lipoprotein carrier protein n=1 Tax=Halorhodospira halophila (strain DSM 244 / SL1) TaxID=349124 RepID=LOLA_HALHL|nr:outer membrane lipoprotein chaperone LolA [Halorhodospira halophila]A1WWU9.1 RecName: Full=Outer-membrane lipoprotein carrier protein; Flags: Precursor [Halorhodospira halophila SL1]ABM62161.1 outer membrane lipoprotein carrier protein LolA [Halorhodospira halophila SL1]MBK1729489.1 outer membrane lipoprotein carrier protein LolA [Halorhodospira halophila]
MKRTATLLVVALILALNTAQAGQLQALEDYYRDVETVQGVFNQFTLDDRGQVIEESSGDFAIHRPDRFHWSYAGPFSQEIIADGERLWVYDVELDQVTVRDQRAVLGSAPAQLLSGDYADLEELFELAETEDYVRLTPRDGGEAFDEARLGMRDGHPSALEIDDALGQVTRVELDEVRLNDAVDEERFRFEPPEGVDVYEADPDEGIR